jgi:hypothetical protein
MVDITKIQLNPIPPNIMELQTTNKILVGKNSVLTDVLIVGGAIALVFVGGIIIDYIKEENERKIKNQFPRVQTSSRE